MFINNMTRNTRNTSSRGFLSSTLRKRYLELEKQGCTLLHTFTVNGTGIDVEVTNLDFQTHKKKKHRKKEDKMKV